MDALKSIIDKLETGMKKFVLSDYRPEIKERIEESRKTTEELESRITNHINGFRSFHERSTMLEYIVDHVDVAVCVFDMNSNYIYANDRYCALYDKKMSEIVGHSVMDVCGEIVWEKVKDNHLQVIAGESIIENYDFVDYFPTNKFDVQYYPYFNGGTSQVGYVMIVRIVER